MSRLTGMTLAAVAALLSAGAMGCSLLQETLPGLASSDSDVASVLHSLGQGEIVAAELAQQKAESPEVRAFAGRLLKEHRELNRANGHLAQELALEPRLSLLARQLAQEHEAAMRTLRAASGPAFERAYVDFEIRRHIRAWNFVQAGADTEATPELKQELVRTGPDLLSHISAARALERHLDGERRSPLASR